MRQCTICGSQAEQHMCGGTPTLPPYDSLSEEIRNLRAGLESLQRSHMQDMEMAIEQRDKAYSELDAMKLQIGEQAKAIRNVQRALIRNENREINMGEAWALITEAVAEKPKSESGEAMVWRACPEHKHHEKKPFKWGPSPWHPCPNCEYRNITEKLETGPQTFTEKRSESSRKIEHCKSPACNGDDNCQCKCYDCLQIVNF
jgi:hypothetical protein